MNKQIFIKLMLFLYSYIPLFIILLIRDLIIRYENVKVNFNIKNIHLNLNDLVFILVIIIIVSSMIMVERVLKNEKKSNSRQYKVINYENKAYDYFLNYTATYIFSLVGIRFNSLVDVVTFSIYIFIVGYIYVTNDLMYLNPTLNFRGYKIYQMEFENQQALKTVIVDKKCEIRKGIKLIIVDAESFYIVKQAKD